MIIVEIIEKQIVDDIGNTHNIEYPVVDGIADEEGWVSSMRKPYSAFFENDEIVDKLISKPFHEINEFFSLFSFTMEQDWWEEPFTCNIYFGRNGDPTYISVDLHFVEWAHWAKPWSISSLVKELEITLNKLGNSKIIYYEVDDDSLQNGFGFAYSPIDPDLVIKPELDFFITVLKNAALDATIRLTHSLENEAVLTYFKFPEEIKTACQQYLIYFAQFMADMGVLVETELKEELNQTLFKVTPKDKNESLEFIRKAINIYLSAPNENNFESEISMQTDIAARQWEATVYYLKSQLALAKSIIEAKDATIESLQLSNFQYKQLLESHSDDKKTDKEDIIKDILSVKPYEGKGFSINLPNLFRRLRRTFKK